MAWKCEQVHEDEGGLPPAQSAEEYALHLAALEWSLAEPIIIQSAKDIKSSVSWRKGSNRTRTKCKTCSPSVAAYQSYC